MKHVFSVLRKSSGFTLVELLIVITVISILATIVYTGVNGIVANAKQNELKTAIINARKKIEDYKSQEGVYPQLDQLPTGTIPANYTSNYFYASSYSWCGAGNCFCLEITDLIGLWPAPQNVSYHTSSVNSSALPGDCNGFQQEANGSGLTESIFTSSPYGSLYVDATTPLKGRLSLGGADTPNGYTGSAMTRVALYLSGVLNTSSTPVSYSTYRGGGQGSWYFGAINYGNATAVVKVEWNSPTNGWEELNSITLP